MPTPDTTETEVDDSPILPADPVPGSIGSAKSYTPPVTPAPEAPAMPPAPETPVTPEPTPAPVAPEAPAMPGAAPVPPAFDPTAAPAPNPVAPAPAKKKLSTTVILAIILGAVVVIGGGILLFMSLSGASATSKNDSANTSGTTTDKPDVAPTENTLTCKTTAGTQDLISMGNATSSTTTITAYYVGGYLDTISSTAVTEYTDVSAANLGKNAIDNYYNSVISGYGSSKDPFTTTENISGQAPSTLTITHEASASQLTTKNGAYFSLDAGADTELEAAEAALKKAGYTCTNK